jgi:ribonuclease HII
MEFADLLRESAHPELFLSSHGYSYIAGVDEAGRGPLAGPVIAAAVIFPTGFSCPDIRDSKTLSAAKRAQLFRSIQEHALAWNWAYSPADEIDRINILQASLLAMKRAVERLPLEPDYTVVDGPHRIPADIPQAAIIDGDAISLPISAASIMAKVVRDSIMIKYHRLYPHYNFAGNKGYGTREHIRALEQHGSCPIHRRTFNRVPR